jgi:hypothetical protein
MKQTHFGVHVNDLQWHRHLGGTVGINKSPFSKASTTNNEDQQHAYHFLTMENKPSIFLLLS